MRSVLVINKRFAKSNVCDKKRKKLLCNLLTYLYIIFCNIKTIGILYKLTHKRPKLAS